MRPLLDSSKLPPAVAQKLGERHPDTLAEVESAIAKHPVVVVGMAQNPHVKQCRKDLDEAGVGFEYLEYGSYLSEWQRRLTIKLWTGWPTFPMVFVKGVLIGGKDLTRAALADGSLKAKIAG